jgi:hypothetical protein
MHYTFILVEVGNVLCTRRFGHLIIAKVSDLFRVWHNPLLHGLYGLAKSSKVKQIYEVSMEDVAWSMGDQKHI